MKLITILIMTALLLWLNCGDDRLTKPAPEPETAWDLTPLEDETAELMALWLSDELVAPMDLYYQIKSDLDTIRSQFADSLERWDDELEVSQYPIGPDWEIGFRLPWYHSQVIVKIKDTATLRLITTGGHHEWNKMMDSLRVVNVTESGFGLFVHAYFLGRLNPGGLRRHIDGLDGVEGTARLPRAISGVPTSLIVPSPAEDDIRYFFDFSWWDNSPDLDENGPRSLICYIDVHNDSAILIDSWLPLYGDTIRPAWADTFVTLARQLAY